MDPITLCPNHPKNAGPPSTLSTPSTPPCLHYPAPPERLIHPDHPANPLDGVVLEPGALAPLNCVYRDDAHGIWLYHGNCLTILDAIGTAAGNTCRTKLPC